MKVSDLEDENAGLLSPFGHHRGSMSSIPDHLWITYTLI